jgi:hypothetical protein
LPNQSECCVPTGSYSTESTLTDHSPEGGRPRATRIATSECAPRWEAVAHRGPSEASNGSSPTPAKTGRSSRASLKSFAMSATACSRWVGSSDAGRAAAPRSTSRPRQSSIFATTGSGTPGCTSIAPRGYEQRGSRSRRRLRSPASPGLSTPRASAPREKHCVPRGRCSRTRPHLSGWRHPTPALDWLHTTIRRLKRCSGGSR